MNPADKNTNFSVEDQLQLIQVIADEARSTSINKKNLRMVRKCERLIEKSKMLDKRCESVLGTITMQKRQLQTDVQELSSDDNEEQDTKLLKGMIKAARLDLPQ